jgi:hypothetical protein
MSSRHVSGCESNASNKATGYTPDYPTSDYRRVPPGDDCDWQVKAKAQKKTRDGWMNSELNIGNQKPYQKPQYKCSSHCLKFLAAIFVRGESNDYNGDDSKHQTTNRSKNDLVHSRFPILVNKFAAPFHSIRFPGHRSLHGTGGFASTAPTKVIR